MAWNKQGNIKGPVGPNGTPGVKGSDGTPGQDGAKGASGVQGSKGDAGADGHIGLQGVKGNTGAKGNPGPAGPRGNDGTDGSKGIDGKDGTGVTIKGSAAKADILAKTGTAGDMWLITSTGADHGHGLVSNGVGAGAANWTDVGAIQGPKGATGHAGAHGAKGAKGDAGVSWHLAGRDTEAVILAKTGQPGDMWIIHEPGKPKDGHAIGWDPLLKPNPGWRDMGQFKGDKGDQGQPGHAGTAGVNGTKGDPGATGPRGIHGVQGTAGVRGTKWFTGTTDPSGTIAGSKSGDLYLNTITGDVLELG